MIGSNWSNMVYKSDGLPPTTVSKKVKNSEEYQHAMLDSLEHIAKKQFTENLKFNDFYRMMDNEMTYQELREVIPHLEGLQDLLNGVEIPTFLKHYDILGSIVRDIVGRHRDMQDKFYITDIGDVAENEYQKFKFEQIVEELNTQAERKLEKHMAENGIDPQGQKFQSPQEQQQFMMQLEQKKQELEGNGAKATKKKTFKTIGMQWAQVTLKGDNEKYALHNKDADNMKDKVLTGRCFRHFIIHPNGYDIENWSPKNVFFSKEIGSRFTQDGEYIGRLTIETPAGVIKRYGHNIDTKTQKEILGGRSDWKNFVGEGFFSDTIENNLRTGGSKPVTVPFANYFDYKYYLALQDETGVPMGEYTQFNKDGSQETQNTFLPRYGQTTNTSAKFYANILRSDFQHRNDLCEIVEAYVRCYDKYGFLTYEDENGSLVTEEVTEDILPEFLKERGIKQIKNQSLVEVITKAPEPNTIVWINRPVMYEGVKITCPNVVAPIYLYFRECEHQIKGAHVFDVQPPVSGFVGRGVAERIMPFQARYNLLHNQITNMLEKEIGIFFLLDVALIPSDVEGYGDAKEALYSMRDIIKDVGFAPVQTSGDADKNQNHFNQFSTYNLSYQGQIEYRIRLAEDAKRLAYEQVGSNPQLAVQPSKYETAEGIRLGQEISVAQLAEIYDEFSEYRQRTLEMHLSVAQYCQSNNLDFSVPMNRDDGTMMWLRFNDPSLPFRTLGLIPTENSNKKKELEMFKQYLLNNNTIQSDFMEVARLISSEAMVEAIEIANNTQLERRAQEEANHGRQMEAITEDAKLKAQAEDKRFEREVELKKIDGRIKLGVAETTAKGRAADKEANQEGYREIEESNRTALAELGFETKLSIEEGKLDRLQNKDKGDEAFRMKQLALKTQELRTKIELKNKDVQIAAMNKN